jgi:signal transduction histidine kinase
MGLPICKNIIETHGGAIDIESAAGKGTVVSFTIPVMNDERTGNDNG